MEENEEKMLRNYLNFKRKLHNFKTNLITTLRYILAKKIKWLVLFLLVYVY